MNGHVDAAGRALVTLRLRPRPRSVSTDLTVWIDTAFTGDLVISREKIRQLGLPLSGPVPALLADGGEVLMDSFHCVVDWFGIAAMAEVIENEGQLPLLCIGLLRNRRVEVNYRSSTVTID